MTTGAIDNDRLLEVMDRLGEAVVDPAAWPEIMEAICRAVAASGAILLQSDARTPDVPQTESLEEVTRLYFKDGWQLRDSRAPGIPRMFAGEVITDHDVLSPEQIRSDGMYNDVLRPFGFQWFAGIGFWAESAAWVLSIQRTVREGSFEADDKKLLARLAPRLTETATLATAVGRVALTSMTNVLDRVRQPALVVNQQGVVLSTNAAADTGFDDEICVRDRRLMVRDKNAAARLDRLIGLIRYAPDSAALSVAPIAVRRTAKPPVIIRVLPIDGAARNVFLGARAMLVFSNLTPRAAPEPALIAQAFDLTAAEARLVSLLAHGVPIEDAARQLRIAKETARNQLKSAFSKTGTHRQAELVSLVSQFA